MDEMMFLKRLTTKETKRFRKLSEQLEALRSEIQAGKKRLREIDLALADAVGKERDALLTERSLLQASADSLPTRVGEIARRRCLAHLEALRKEAKLAKEEAGELDVKLSAAANEIAGIRSELNHLEAQRIGRAITREQESARAASLRQRWDEIAAEVRPLRMQYHRVKIDAQVCALRAKLLYNADLHNEQTWERAAIAVGRAAEREADRLLHGCFDAVCKVVT